MFSLFLMVLLCTRLIDGQLILDEIEEEEDAVVFTEDNDPSTLRLAGCSNKNEKCKSFANCAFHYAESADPLQICSLDESNDQRGLCCPDLPRKPGKGKLPTEFGGSDEESFSSELDHISAADLAAGSDDGVNYLKQLEAIEKRIKNDENLKIDPRSPEAGHLKVFQTTEEARDIAVRGLQLAVATKVLKTRLGLSDPDMELRQINVLSTRLGESCPPLPACPSRLSKYRSHNGACNNPKRPWIGRTSSPTQRLLHPHYEDRVQAPRLAVDGNFLPSARALSFLFSPTLAGQRAPQDRKLTALVADFGQLLDHDLIQTPVFRISGGGGIRCCASGGQNMDPSILHPQCMPIEIPPDDPFYGTFGRRCMSFVRSMVAPQQNCTLGAIQQMNAVSHWLDGSMIYGSGRQQARSLMGSRGTMAITGFQGPGALLPKQNACTQRGNTDNPNFCFRAGDNRVNEQPLLAALTTLFVREHNRVAIQLADMHPEWSDDGVYHESRRIVVAELQHIIYNEYLPTLLGTRFMETYGLLPLSSGFSDDYNQNYDGSITNAFGAAAFRLHTLVSGIVRFTDEAGNSQRLRLRQVLNSPQILVWPEAGDALLRGQTSRPLNAFDPTFTDELTNHLFEVNGPFGLDLFALNVQRGRDHGLPSYNNYRKLCGLPRARGFTDLIDTVRPEALNILKQMYNSVEDIDLYIGGLSEKRSSGSLLGHTFLCLVGDQFARLKKGDRFFYDLSNQPSSFTLDQLNEIRRTSMARIICDNSMTISSIQPLVFQLRNSTRNPPVSCDSSRIPRMSLRPWISEIPEV